MHDITPKEKWHGAHHYSDRIHLLVVLFLFFAIIAMLWSYFELNSGRFNYRNSPGTNGEKPCTQEAKICPDGTAVGREGPNCEFAKCP
ncbi:MAG: hypothetical protein AAB520_01550 [Patescibacteria group bacterium]